MWLQATHFFDVLFLSLLVRTGIEILSAHPRLYWNDDCTPGSEWLTLSKKTKSADQLHTADDEEVSFSSWIPLPGRKHLDLGRHWHLVSVVGWIVTGLVYVGMLLMTSEWRRLSGPPHDRFAGPINWSCAFCGAVLVQGVNEVYAEHALACYRCGEWNRTPYPDEQR